MIMAEKLSSRYRHMNIHLEFVQRDFEIYIPFRFHQRRTQTAGRAGQSSLRAGRSDRNARAAGTISSPHRRFCIDQ